MKASWLDDVGSAVPDRRGRIGLRHGPTTGWRSRGEDAATVTSIGSAEPTRDPTDDSGPAAPGVVATVASADPAGHRHVLATGQACGRGRRTGVGPAGTQDHRRPSPTAGRSRRAPVTSACAWTVPTVCRRTVTIARTQLEPADAFTEYADKVMAVSPVSSVSVLPGELCGYSGQKLMGTWSDNPQQSVEFLDRIVHIWTNSNNYLVAVHVEAPAGHRRHSTPPRRCSSRTSPSAYPEVMLTELVELPGGSFRMGSTSFYPEEAPIHTARCRRVRDRTTSGHQRAVRRIRRRRPATSPSPSRSSIPRCIPGPTPPTWCPARWCSGRRPDRSTCGTGGSGGTGNPARAGGTRSARTAGSTTGSTIPSCRSPIPTRPPMPAGPGGGCRPRRSGSTRHAAAAPRPTHGATTRHPAAS